MYTGSGTVGKIIMTAAAKHLTPPFTRGTLHCATRFLLRSFTLCRLCDAHAVGRQITRKTADLKLTARRDLFGQCQSGHF
jgi:hypothetical protein